MKCLTILISLFGIRLLGQSLTSSFTNSATTTIPDGNPVGVIEQFVVSGVSGGITNVTVQLDITGGFNGDLYAYLVDPAGDLAVLLNRVGVTSGNPFGYSDAGFNITLTAAGNDIHTYQTVLNPGGGQLTGTWAVDGRNINPQSSPSLFGNASTEQGLNIYQGLDGGSLNGTWTLFIADLVAGGGNPTLQNAVLSILTVPEPSSISLVVAGGLLMWITIRKKMFGISKRIS